MANLEWTKKLVGLQLGAKDNSLAYLQDYLQTFGYLSSEFDRGVFDPPTQMSLKLFQEATSLKMSGEIDEPTADLLSKPRCGVPDHFSFGKDLSAGFVPIGCSYQGVARTLLYRFLNSTPDLAGDVERDPVRRAFETWSQAAPIDFLEVPGNAGSNLSVGWYSGAHGDTSPFDRQFGVLAHAYFPPPCGGRFAGACHFDDSEVWAIGQTRNAFDLETVALHEIGHLIGLAHSSNPNSVMFAFNMGERRALHADDVAGIQSIYGSRGPSLRIRGHIQSAGDVLVRENEFVGTRGRSMRLEGLQIEMADPVTDLTLEYMAHVQGFGDSPWLAEGQFAGTRGQKRSLEGFAVRLVGAAAEQFNVIYMAHLQGSGDTAYSINGEFCGTRGQKRRLEGLLVRIERRE